MNLILELISKEDFSSLTILYWGPKVIMKEFPNSGLKRIYHSNTNSWQKNLYEEITLSKKDKQSRIDEVIRFVETLKNGELKNEQ